MTYYLNQAQQILFHEPRQAWIFLSLIYLAAALFIQYLLTSSLRKAVKKISSKNLKGIESKYLYRSILGWILFLVSGGLFIAFWYDYYFEWLMGREYALCFEAGSVLLFLVSIIFHLSAYAVSCVDQIRALEDKNLSL